jgi:catechol 2,3-dioxygenase-like lactoylglutathione lyase family enzyme
MRDEFTGIELRITRLAQSIAYPSTPPIAASVRARVSETAVAPPPPLRMRSLAGVGLAALVVALAMTVAFVAPARDAAAGLFDRINIFQAAEIPSDLTTDIRGEHISFEEAQRRVGWRIVQPTDPDGSTLNPEEVLYQQFSSGGPRGVVSFYLPDGSAPFALFQTDAGLGKGLGSGATSEPVSGLGDGRAYWLQGLRIVQLYDSAGNLIRESQRQTKANTLVWMQNSLVYRIEGELSQEEALRLARSLK